MTFAQWVLALLLPLIAYLLGSIPFGLLIARGIGGMDIRESGSGNIGKGFVKGFGLKHGALASSVAHDSHNIIVVGTTDEDMVNLALWLKRNGFRADQVQSFLPSPMASATAMYHSGRNPLRRVGADSERVSVPRGLRVRRLHKAFLRYHDANNWPLLRQALKRMGRADLIGNGKRHLIPRWQQMSLLFSYLHGCRILIFYMIAQCLFHSTNRQTDS